MKKLIFFSLVLAVVMLVPNTVNAARESLTLSPPKSEFKLSLGQQVSGAIKVTNSGEQPVEIELYAQTFAIKNEQYDQEFYSSDNPLAAQNWIKIDAATRYLASKQQQNVNYQINVPDNAEPGGHYVAIFAQTRPQIGTGGVAEVKRVAHLLYFEISGNMTKSGLIKSTKYDFWQRGSMLRSQVRAVNTGNVHYRIDGSVVLKNILGGKISSSRLEGLLMPHTTRLFLVENDTPKWPGFYRLEAKIGFPNGKSSQSSSWVLYLPTLYLYVLGIFILVVVLYVVIKKPSKRRNKT